MVKRDVRSIDEMRALIDAGGDLSDVVFHYTCPVCGKRKKVTVSMDSGNAYKQFVGDKSRLDAVLASNGRCVTCSIKAGELEYKRFGGDDNDDDYED